MKILKHWDICILLVLWLYICQALFGQRFIPTHDGEYHIIRIYEFYKMLVSGNLFPRWAPGLNSGFGFPLFIFHYPLPNYIGSIFYLLGFSLVHSFQMSLAFGVLSGGISCYLFIKKEYSSRFAPFIGTLLFFTIPYLFVDVYVRGSIGEVWGIAFCLLTLASIAWNKKIIIALSIALLITSHNIMAMIMIPIIFLYMVFFYKKQIPYLFWGIAIAAYFWMPALLESKYMIGLNSVTYSDHFPTFIQLLFPSWGTVFSQPGMVANEISQQIGIIPLFILLFTSIKTLITISNKKSNLKTIYFLLISAAAIFFLLPISDPLWKIFSFIQYIQYPWRLLSVLLITIPFIGAGSLEKSRSLFRWGVIIFAIVCSFSYMTPVSYEPRNDLYYLTKKEFTDGTSSLGNSFSTIWRPWIQTRAASAVEILEGKATIKDIQTTPSSVIFSVNSEDPSKVRINRTYYPGWVVSFNNQRLPIEYESQGLIDISIPKSTGTIIATFGETSQRRIADSISLVSLSSLILFSILSRRYARSH